MSASDGSSQTTRVRRKEEEPPGGSYPAVDIESIDLEALAVELVARLRQELRLERERQGWHSVDRR